MQDAHIGSWALHPHLPREMLESLRELNGRFLELVAGRRHAWAGPSVSLNELSLRLASLSPPQKAAIADCPYALFDLRFGDDGHWLAQLRASSCWAVGESSAVDDDTLEFVRTALFFAWHVASKATHAVQLLMGVSATTAAALHATTIDRLMAIAAVEAPHLSARWKASLPYWDGLTRAAAHSNAAHLRQVQLYGLQLAAAARLT